MLRWFIALTRRGKLIFWGVGGILFTGVLLSLGMIMPQVLGIALAYILIAFFLPGEKTGDAEEYFEKFGKKDVLTSTVQFHTSPDKLDALLSEVSGLYERGLSRAWATGLAKKIRNTPHHQPGREFFTVFHARTKSRLLICWSHEGSKIKLLFEGVKEPVRILKTKQAIYSV